MRHTPLAVELLDPKLDLVFKLLMVADESVLCSMLTAVLRPTSPITKATVLNPGVPGDFPVDKEIVLDIRVVLANGEHIDIEMQARFHAGLPERLLFYWGRLYVQQLSKGSDYHKLHPTSVIVWLDGALSDDAAFHSIYEVRERLTHRLFSNHLAVHVLELPKLVESRQNDLDSVRWARFLLADSPSDFDQLAAEDRIMSKAKDILERLSADPDTRELARQREEGMLRFKLTVQAAEDHGEARGLVLGEAKGLALGEAKGRRALLTRLFILRFGQLSENVYAQLDRASDEQLDSWADAILTAANIDELLATKPAK